MFPTFRTIAIAACLAAATTPVCARDVEPSLRIDHPAAKREIALTFDACSGETDHRILDLLVRERIPATIFVTGRWLRRNGEALAVLEGHPELFEIENHGAEHVPAVTDASRVFGIPTAGTLAGVQAEVDGGALAIFSATGRVPHWFRGATARYSLDAVALIESEGYRIAGYSLNADMGASLLPGSVEKRLAAAKDGDVVIAHINQPTHASGAGLAAGILALKNAGATFVRLEDADESDGNANAGKTGSHPSF